MRTREQPSSAPVVEPDSVTVTRREIFRVADLRVRKGKLDSIPVPEDLHDIDAEKLFEPRSAGYFVIASVELCVRVPNCGPRVPNAAFIGAADATCLFDDGDCLLHLDVRAMKESAEREP